MKKYTQTCMISTLFVIFLNIGCGVAEKRQARNELEEGRARWEAKGIQDYEMTVEAFCPDIVTGPADVVVQNGQVVAVYEPGTTGPKTYWTAGGEILTEQEIEECYLTVDELFELHEEVLNQRLTQAEFRTDPTLGYPTWVFFDSSRWVEDDSYALEITRLTPLESSQ